MSSDDLDGLRSVAEAVAPTWRPANTATTSYYFRRMCAAGAVDCLQADVTRCGGITEWLRIAAVAAAHGLGYPAHCAPQLHAHVAAATPNLRHLEWFHDHARIEAMVFDGCLAARAGCCGPTPSRRATADRAASRRRDRYRAVDNHRSEARQ